MPSVTTPTRMILGVAEDVSAAATEAATSVLTVINRQRKGLPDPYEGEPFGQLPSDRVCTVAADDGVPLHVQEIDPADGGESQVTLIGVHDLGLSCSSWHFQRRDLASLALPRVRQVYFDQRGHGLSGTAPDDTSTLEQLASDLYAVIRAMAADGKVVLAGHGLGGAAIIALAEQHPELFGEHVVGVALISTAAGDVASSGVLRPLLWKYSPVGWGVGGLGELADWQPEIVGLVRAAGGRVTKAAVRRMMFGSAAPSSVVDFTLQMANTRPLGELTRFVGTLGEHQRYDALKALRNVKVQVIAGADDVVVPFSHSERIGRELPAATVVRLREVGHMPQLEQPDVVTSQLIDLLQGCLRVGRGGLRVVPAQARNGRVRNIVRRWRER